MLLKQPKVVHATRYRYLATFILSQSYLNCSSLADLGSWFTLWWFHLLHFHCLLQNSLLPINADPRIAYSILYIPSAIFATYSLLYTAPTYSLTNAAVRTPTDGHGHFQHVLPKFLLHCFGRWFWWVPLFLSLSFLLSLVFDILLSRLNGTWYHTCNVLTFCNFPFLSPQV